MSAEKRSPTPSPVPTTRIIIASVVIYSQDKMYLDRWSLHKHFYRPLHEPLVSCRHAIAEPQGQINFAAGLARVEVEVFPSQGNLAEKVPSLPCPRLNWGVAEDKRVLLVFFFYVF